jgi:hypothetical protein
MARYTGAPFRLSAEIRDQLQLGLPGPHSDRELRAAWALFGAELAAETREPGARPWGWWQFEAGRPAHLLPEPPFTGADPETIAQARDQYAIEPLQFLAEQGALCDEERAALLARARPARARIGTDHQLGELRITASGVRVWSGGDRTAVAVGEALRQEGSR